MMKSSKTNLLSHSWASARREDIGGGFRRASDKNREELTRKNVETAAVRAKRSVTKKAHEGEERHPFLNGRNKFIFYKLSVQPPPKKRKKIEALTKVSTVEPAQRRLFESQLGRNIDRAVQFYVNEIMPISLSTLTAASRVDEIISQMTEDKANLPVDYIRQKTTNAIQLRIIRFISETYKLTPDEYKMLTAEYRIRARDIL